MANKRRRKSVSVNQKSVVDLRFGFAVEVSTYDPPVVSEGIRRLVIYFTENK